jgi:hypothetical protein
VIEVKDILYSTIECIGKEKIRSDVTSNIELSQKYIDIIMCECISKLAQIDSNANNNEEIIATLSEALLHFMLTVCTLPSERKIHVDRLTLDVVIPNLQTLKRKPVRSIIIQIIKDKKDFHKISQLELLQPNYKNIWLLCAKPLSVKKYTIYGVFQNSDIYNSYSNMIIDINDFLEEAGDKSFRFIH